MELTASKLRENIYKVLDSVLESGEPVEIVRKGRRLRIVAVDPEESEHAPRRGRLDGLRGIPDAIVGDPDELVDLDVGACWEPGPIDDDYDPKQPRRRIPFKRPASGREDD